ncbi:MAG: amino acid ABC transporter substrate-binding protein [Deltaproteobacteria bacterium]|nr:amino acid ABC transporter substrate-binding protein [Deltaproteobacteria bacterium]
MRRLGMGLICLAIAGLLFGMLISACHAPAPPKDKLIIGFTASQTGKLNVEAIRQINGINLWVEQVNKAGGIKLADGKKIKIEAKFYDDESNKDRVQELYTRLINNDKADFLISPYSSGLADAAAVIAQQYKRIMVTAGASSDSTQYKGYSLVYMTYTPASKYLAGAVDLLAKLAPEAKKIAIIHEKDKFSTDSVNGLKKYAEGKGYQIAMFEGYDSGNTDFAPFINKIPAGVDAVMGGGHFADTTTLTRQLYEKKLKTKMVALLVAPPEPKFAELGEACIGVIGSSMWEPFAKYSPEAAKAAGLEWFGPTIPEFVKEYKAKYNNEEPSYHSAGGYAAGLILQKAMEKAGSTETDKVKAAIDAEDMFTFYGHIKFDTTPKAHGLQIGHQMIIIQWQKDQQGKPHKVAVYPPEAATGQGMVYPTH